MVLAFLVFIDLQFQRILLKLYWGGGEGSSRVPAVYFVFMKFHFVRFARLTEMSLLCRVGGRLITLWEPFSWDNTIPGVVARAGSHVRNLPLALTLKESVTLRVVPRERRCPAFTDAG